MSSTEQGPAAHEQSPALVAEAQRRRRTTAKQHAVLSALQDSDRFRSAQQLYVELRQKHSLRIGLTSIYRILHVLADERVAETQRAENGELLYRLRAVPDHRHYLLCRHCGRAVAFAAPTLEDHAYQLVQQHGYAEVTHNLDIYGICPQCQNTPRVSSGGRGTPDDRSRP